MDARLFRFSARLILFQDLLLPPCRDSLVTFRSNAVLSLGKRVAFQPPEEEDP